MSPSASNTDLMIMISTKAQISNYKVYLHYSPKKIVALSSKLAKSNNWCFGFRQLLGNKFEELFLRSASIMDVDQLKEVFQQLLQTKIQSSAGKCIWAWAGGQKPHSTALYLLAREYKANDPAKHEIVYTDGNEDRFYIDGIEEPTSLSTPLDTTDVLTMHGLTIKENRKAPELSEEAELKRFLTDQEVRRAEWQPPDFVTQFKNLQSQPALAQDDIIKIVCDPLPNNILQRTEQVLDKLIQKQRYPHQEAQDFLKALKAAKDAGICKSLFFQALSAQNLRMKKEIVFKELPSGKLFEQYARKRLMNWYLSKGKHLVSSLAFEVMVEGINYQAEYGTRPPESAAEFDCLISTRRGRFIAIDFKSAGRRNYRAQRSSVTQAGGDFAELFYLYPWIEKDLPPQAGAPETRSPEIRNRMGDIVKLDKDLRPESGKKRGIRFYSEDAKFYEELETILRLK